MDDMVLHTEDDSCHDDRGQHGLDRKSEVRQRRINGAFVGYFNKNVSTV